MSGGVDSSVAAYLLKEAGWTVGGATIRTWASGECIDRNTKACCGVIGVEDARDVAWKLEIPYRVFNFEREFKTHVVDYFQNEYLNGKTPNPCVACNQHIKFKLFYQRARELGYDFIATGHYARVVLDPATSRYLITQGVDPGKDQSYVLFPLGQDILSRLELPVGSHTKDEIRTIARTLGLRVADKPDSQEICFIPSNDYAAFLERELKLSPDDGPIQDRQGNALGRHKGYYHYTIGQRSGLGISFPQALYVIDIVPEKNLVVVGTKDEARGRVCEVDHINWFVNTNGIRNMRAEVKIRSRHQKAWADLEVISPSRVRVRFDEPQEAITPGQGCVFYDNDRVLGGGWIAKSVEAVAPKNSASVLV